MIQYFNVGTGIGTIYGKFLNFYGVFGVYQDWN
jgi:hypothetical protein